MMEPPSYNNLDDQAAFDQCQQQLDSDTATNFLVYFDDDHASCATNISEANVEHVLHNRREEAAQGQCLWINLWGWTREHHEIVKAVARVYEVSPRLAHMVCPKPTSSPRAHSPASMPAVSTSDLSGDLEKANSTPTISGTEGSTKPPGRKAIRGISDIVEDLWHFYSFDMGRRYISLSWNAVFFVPSTAQTLGDTHKPTALRVWSSVLLFDDGTILSVFERPQKCDSDMRKRVRFNQMNIFRHLSRCVSQQAAENPLMQISVRASGHKVKSSVTDLTSLMLYYLFDDWVNIYEQITGGRESYRFRLEEIRDQMIASASVDQVKTLHAVGRQLIVLKSIYRSYQAIIDRIILRVQVLDTVHRSEDLARTATIMPGSPGGTTATHSSNTVTLHESQVRLSPNAIARFERLKDRIEICALTEVEECLNEKEAMVLMNFNLVQLKESRAIEKLTRTTILLAKVTILFLPLSLVSGYFSLQFEAIDQLYSLKTFWLTFMVVAVLTIAFLVGSNALGLRYGTKGFYRSWMKDIIESRKKKKAGG